MENRRRHKRYTLASFDIHSDMTFATDVKLLDISLGGVSLKADMRLNMGREYIVKIKAKDKVINIRGEVIWSSLCDHSEARDGQVIPIYKAGLKFTHVSDEKLSELGEFMETYDREVDRSLSLCQLFDQRLFRRLKLDVPESATILYDYEGCKVKALSLAGMLIESDFPLEIEDKIPMKLILTEDKSITFQGRIASCLPAAGAVPRRYNVGVGFLEMSETDKNVLEAFIRLLDTTGQKLREYDRFFIREDVLIDGTRMCTSIDISEGGLYISTLESYEKNAVIDVTIPFKGEKLTVKGKVRYYQPGIGIGVMFINLNNEQRSKIRELVSSITKKPA